jgi:hypoxanthine phosphoribosyltransferase
VYEADAYRFQGFSPPGVLSRQMRAHPTAQKGLSEAVASLATVRAKPTETPSFRVFRGSQPPRFANQIEVECAKILDYYGVPWDYEPRSFVLERDETGRVTKAFTPDFYLPEQDLYVEVTVMKQSLVTRKNRKLRELQQLYPGVRIKLFYRRDIERLAQRYQLRLAS